MSAANYTAIISIDDTNKCTECVPLLSPKPANGSVAVTRGSDGAWAIDDRATLAAALLDGYDPRQISID